MSILRTVALLLVAGLLLPAPRALAGVSRTVHFANGSSGTVIDGAVIRGDRDRYFLGASAGQTMTVSVKSAESNAVFDLEGPAGETLSSEATRWSGRLPKSGKYTIVVGGTRGNASYHLSVTIR